MNVSLTPDLTRFVDERVASGLYTSASEVVREGLRLLVQFDSARAKGMEEFSAIIANGLAQAEAGNVIDGDEGLARTRARIAARRAKRRAV